MDAKVTLSFDSEVITAAKKYADEQGISLSRLTEFLYRQIVKNSYNSLDDLPVSHWVSMVAEGEAEHHIQKGRKNLNATYFKDKK